MTIPKIESATPRPDSMYVQNGKTVWQGLGLACVFSSTSRRLVSSPSQQRRRSAGAQLQAQHLGAEQRDAARVEPTRAR